MPRFRSLAGLFVGMLILASTPVLSQEKAKSDPSKNPTAKKADAKVPAAISPDPEVAELKKSLATLKDELAAAKLAAEEAKKTSADTGTKLSDVMKVSEESTKAISEAKTAGDQGVEKGDIAWMLVSSALVMFMLPGLALFYGGMVRRKNILATMMQSMACLAIVGLYWVAVGYSLAFGPSVLTMSILGQENAGIVGWSWDLFFLQNISTDMKLPGLTIPVYAHVMFQGMFAIITPALISGALAERIRFWPFMIFCILWISFVYCPLAHMVWAFDWFYAAPVDAEKGLGMTAVGLLGKLGALDFAGGTVVHIAAGMAGLVVCLVIRRREGYPKSVVHPSGMVLTLLGAGFLWFGWFGFNGGSAVASNALAVSAFAATQTAAAAAGLGWMLIEWLHKGKPTALGLASGIVAGLVAVTPASGFVYIWGAIAIGVLASAACYAAVWLKSVLGYDDSLDAFGVHGVGGFVGAILTGLFCYTAVNSAGPDGYFAIRSQTSRIAALESSVIADAEKAVASEADATKKTALEGQVTALKEELTKLKEQAAAREKDGKGSMTQFVIQLKACVFSLVFATVISLVLALLTQLMTLGNLTTDKASEVEGLDRTEHGEVAFDFGYATESFSMSSTEPIAATRPKLNGRFELLVEGAEPAEIAKAWTDLCMPSETPSDPNFLAIYPHITTFSGNTFRCRGEDKPALSHRMETLFKKLLPGKPIQVVEI